MSIRFNFCLISLCALFLVCIGCTPESIVQSRLGKLLENYDYTLYTPFRTKDFPATVFVLTKNHKTVGLKLRYQNLTRLFL